MQIFPSSCDVIIFTNCVFSSFLIMLFVERWFFLYWSKWPSAVYTDFGKYFVIFLFVSAGHVVKLLFSTSLSGVDFFGLPNTFCRYIITSSVFLSIIKEFIWAVGVRMCFLVCVFCALGVVIGILHNVFSSLYILLQSLCCLWSLLLCHVKMLLHNLHCIVVLLISGFLLLTWEIYVLSFRFLVYYPFLIHILM